jgi:hypothetical protein
MKEPKAKNLYKVPRHIWRVWKEDERHFFNKMYNYMYFHIEQFTDVEMSDEEWRAYVFSSSMYGTDTFRRTKIAIFR